MTEEMDPTYFFRWRGFEFVINLEARCTAATKAGPRCRNWVFNGQDWDYGDDHEALILLGGVALAQALSLMCHVHAPTLAAITQAVETKTREESMP